MTYRLPSLKCLMDVQWPESYFNWNKSDNSVSFPTIMRSQWYRLETTRDKTDIPASWRFILFLSTTRLVRIAVRLFEKNLNDENWFHHIERAGVFNRFGIISDRRSGESFENSFQVDPNVRQAFPFPIHRQQIHWKSSRWDVRTTRNTWATGNVKRNHWIARWKLSIFMARSSKLFLNRRWRHFNRTLDRFV